MLPLRALAAALAEAYHPSLAQTMLVLGGPGWPLRTAGQVDDLAAAVYACSKPTPPSCPGHVRIAAANQGHFADRARTSQSPQTLRSDG